MAVKTHTWVSLWFLLTAPVIFWDAGYCLMRPRSMKGGDLHWIWKPYALYQEIDHVYGVPAFEAGDGFPSAQSFMNILETLLNLAYLYLAHVTQSPAAPVVGFASAVMTLSKTMLYWVQEYYCNYCAVGHNSFLNLVVYWIVPNGLWLAMPSLIVRQLGRDLADGMARASTAGTKAAVTKKKK
ncbi:hypothetical protein AMATHDRAFT_58683 [Amanita thiersii Skay4041]|uniref:EXPERA domain-containing protein n=1 Tax=Amanita thiersii Skay4041 TaxID=703135 RepID=A0A2A9NKT1_9AGAR|nr:hypothetical protein AMATHDRAFT_58683 [Amanita thiersii Skay4041]